MHMFSIMTALISGGLYGALVSTKFTLQEFEKLGGGYELGRIAHKEIERYRMDRPYRGSER